MTNTTTRLFVTAIFVVLIYFANRLVESGLKLPDVALPDRDFSTMPMNFGSWHGEETELDPKIFRAIGAAVAVNRLYRDGEGHAVSSHVAVFANPDEAIYHSPINCYRANGWRLIEDTREPLPVADGSDIQVRFTVWERARQRAVVVYWFQLGEHVFFNRFEMGWVRWAMRNQQTWPATIKVMLQVPAGANLNETKELVAGLGASIFNWVSDSNHSAASKEAH